MILNQQFIIDSFQIVNQSTDNSVKIRINWLVKKTPGETPNKPNSSPFYSEGTKIHINIKKKQSKSLFQSKHIFGIVKER